MAKISKVKTNSPSKYRLTYRVNFPDYFFVYRSRRYKTRQLANAMWPKSAELEEKTKRGTYTNKDIEQWRRLDFLNKEDIRRLGHNSELKTFGMAVAEYRDSWDVSPKEGASRSARLNLILSVLESDRPLKMFKHGDGIKIQNELRARRYKIATIQKCVQDLKRCFNLQVANQAIDFNPFNSLKGGRIPREEKIKPIVLTDSQVSDVIGKAEGSPLLNGWLKILLLMFFGSGLRRNEALNLKWEDIDWNEQSILVTEKIAKTGRARKVGLGQRLFYELLLRKKGGGFIFPRFHPDSVSKAIKKHFAKCNLKMRLHDMRHTYASLIQQKAGAKPIEAMARTGHADMRMLSHYSHGKFGKIFEDEFEFMKVNEGEESEA